MATTDEDRSTYAITYVADSHDPPVLMPDGSGRGACDSIIIASIIHSDGQTEMLDGSTSTALISVNGRTRKELTPTEIFQVWATMANHLVGRLPRGGSQAMCKTVVDIVREAVDGREPNELDLEDENGNN